MKAEGRSRYATDFFAARNEASYTGVAGPNDAGNADRTAPGNAINSAAYGRLLSLFLFLTDSTIAWNAAPSTADRATFPAWAGNPSALGNYDDANTLGTAAIGIYYLNVLGTYAGNADTAAPETDDANNSISTYYGNEPGSTGAARNALGHYAPSTAD